jgi:hypothetical protein
MRRFILFAVIDCVIDAIKHGGFTPEAPFMAAYVKTGRAL